MRRLHHNLTVQVLFAITCGIVLGLVIERCLLKYLYDRDEHIVVLAVHGRQDPARWERRS